MKNLRCSHLMFKDNSEYGVHIGLYADTCDHGKNRKTRRYSINYRLRKIYDRDNRSIIFGPFDLVEEWYDHKVEQIMSRQR